ncbi:MAG: hypothetical protein U9R75_06375, partial [Candidatus Thermoplasmatota archaeon]|nr:hypothetical protein [Candidatus Thermoplasmatota archaeon]
KVGRVHADIGKALGTVKNTISTLRESGLMREGVEELHREAEELYKKGDLLGCAKKIKFIKTELTRE